jgi:hypothetical protein
MARPVISKFVGDVQKISEGLHERSVHFYLNIILSLLVVALFVL